jgi:hypothetical protein
MTVELLYVPGCPNHKPAARLVRDVLAAEGLRTDLIETRVSTCEEARTRSFPGSPTLRVNGQDIETLTSHCLPVGFACRTYAVEGKQQGVPPRSWLERAIRAARALEKSS